MVRGKAPVHVDRKGVHVTLDEVPAWVCTQCGEAYFEEKDVDMVQGIVRAVESESEKMVCQAA